MLFWCLILTLLYAFANVSSSPIIQCKISDAKCLNTVGSSLYAKIFEVDPKIGTESLDPMYHDLVEGNISILKYKLINTTVEGQKDCKIAKFKSNPTTVLGITVEMLCPKLYMQGTYEVNGRLITLPIEGSGDYNILINSLNIILEIELKITQEKNGNSHIALKKCRINAEPLKPVVFDFKDLFNGQKELAEPVLKFANENWKAVTKEVQGPALSAHFKKIIKNANKVLKNIKLEDFIQI